MYNIPYFKEENASIVLDFMKQHPFAMLIGVDEYACPVATQIPILIKERGGELFLQGHMMKQTDHHKAIQQNSKVLVVFSGKHAYVSASLYENKQQASTWNYQAVHAKGVVNFLDDACLLEMLDQLTNHFENNPASPSLFHHLPKDYVQRLSKAIIAFEVKVTALEHVFKLSQNKDEQTYNNIIQHFKEGNADEQYIAAEMTKRRGGLF